MSVNLKGSTQSNLGYTGIIKLSQYIKNKKFNIATVHNAGCMPLFNFLTECLIGTTDAISNRPTKIMLLNIDNDNVTAADGTGFIYLTTAPEKVYSETEGIIRYSFILPQEYFAGVGGARFNAIGLYLNSANRVDDFAAYCKIDLADQTISMTSVLMLDWELHISNNGGAY